MSSEPGSKSAAAGDPPPPATVPGNDWTAIEVEDVDALHPELAVSVVVCGPDPAGHLPLTLAALGAQTYPAELLHVVIGFAPSESESELRAAANGLEVAVEADDGGAGALAAADSARGELVLLLPAGAIPERELVAAHARWHHAVSDAASVGLSSRVDAQRIDPGALRREVRGEGLGSVLSDAVIPEDADVAALETYLDGTRDLTERRPDGFRVAARGSLCVRRETLGGAGGGGSLVDASLARLDLAYRLDCAGCVIVPEHRAVTFEPYPPAPGSLPRAVEELAASDLGGAAADVDPRVAGLVPAVGFRPPGGGLVHERPAMVVNVAVDEQESFEEVVETVDSVLRGRLQDLELRLGIPANHPQREPIAAACAADPRIVLGAPSGEVGTLSPYQVTLPAIAMPDERTFEDIHELMAAEGMGALHVTVPGELPRNAMVEAVATGPLARARRVAALEGVAVEEVLGRLFGERWVSGVEVSIRRRGDAEPRVTEHGPLAPATDLEHERTQHVRHSSRAATNQAKANRYAERAARERMRARDERARARRLEARIERAQSNRAFALLRPLKRAATGTRARLRG